MEVARCELDLAFPAAEERGRAGRAGGAGAARARQQMSLCPAEPAPRSRPALPAHPGAVLENPRETGRPGTPAGSERRRRLPSCPAAASEQQLCSAFSGQPEGSCPLGSTERGLRRHGKTGKQSLRHRAGDLGHRSCSCRISSEGLKRPR